MLTRFNVAQLEDEVPNLLNDILMLTYGTKVFHTKELKVMYQQLLHAEKLSVLGKLVASVAHELNNPIYGIQMILEQLDETDNLNKKEKKLVGLAIKECSRISRMVNNLKDFYRPSSGLATASDIHQLIREVLEICGKRLRLNNIKVAMDFAENLPKISLVADQIKQVFLNIITNAGDALAPLGGNLTIQTRSQDSNVQIVFKVDGSGIASENIGKIFDPFFTTKVAVRGTGLGLSVSFGIVKRHGGDILVESTPNEGSIFSVELPIS